MRWMLVGLLVMVMALASVAETEIGGEIESQHWGADGNPYILTSDTFLPWTETLTIDPGVQVRAMANVTLTIHGTIHANGSEDHPIVFTTAGDNINWGGIKLVESDSDFEHCVFRNAATVGDELDGGAIHTVASDVDFWYCEFIGNEAARYGAAMHFVNSHNTLGNCAVMHNVSGEAGALSMEQDTDIWFERNVFAFNHAPQGGAIRLGPESWIGAQFSTFAFNTGDQASTFKFQGDFIGMSCIVWTGTDQPFQMAADSTWTHYEWSCLPPGDIGGDGVIHENPHFVNPDDGNFHLTEDSPCIDAADPGSEDPDGTRGDMGAFYFHQDDLPDGPIIGLPEVFAMPGTTVILPMTIHEVGPDMGVMAYEVDIEFSDFYLDIVDVFPIGDGPAGEWLLDWSVTEDHLLISAAGGLPLQHGGPLAGVEIAISPDATIGLTNEFYFVQAQLNEGQPEVLVHHGAITYADLLYGDVSLNQEVSAYDASLILAWLAGNMDLGDEHLLRAEVSGDGNVTAMDAGLILAYTVGNIDQFPIIGGDLWQGSGQPTVPTITWQGDGDLLYYADLGVDGAQNMLSLTLDLSLDMGAVDLVSAESLIPDATVTTVQDGQSVQVFMALSEAYEGSGDVIQLCFEPNDLQGTRDIIWDELYYDQITINEYVVYEDAGITAIGTLEVGEDLSAQPTEHGLVRAYPNPFNPDLTVSVELARAADVELRVVDVLGREVYRMHAGQLTSGRHELQWNAAGQAAGVYFLQSQIGDVHSVQKVMLLK